MTKDMMIGVDLAKNVFQLHAATMTGEVLFRKKLSRHGFYKFMANYPPAVVVMEACGSAHYWAREMIRLGHEVKLIAPQYVKPFVKRQKNDAADAEAIVIAALTTRIAARTAKIKMLSAERGVARRLQTMPGVGPLTALAIEAFAPPMENFRCGRDFAAWLGLVPRQFSSGGKERLGRISKAGQADIRRLLIIGAMSRLNWLGRKSIPEGSWLARMVARKPRMLVAIALANKMARTIWAMLTKNEDYREPTQAVTA
uniref:Transposase n=1 Tax=Magnetovibrio blakemorei TaxID=28181 RepID=C4RAA3_9PROT|nr:Transposase [Magnetovibrio blakemorei]